MLLLDVLPAVLSVDSNGVCCPHGSKNGVCCSGICPLEVSSQFIRLCPNNNGRTNCACCTGGCPCCPALSDPKCDTEIGPDGCKVCKPKCGNLKLDPTTGVSMCCDLVKCAQSIPTALALNSNKNCHVVVRERVVQLHFQSHVRRQEIFQRQSWMCDVCSRLFT